MKKNEISLPWQVAETLKERILLKKEYKVGDKLPNEIILSEQLNISRTTLREAIRILVNENLLEIKRGKGTFVINDNIDIYNLGNLNKVHTDLKDLLEVRLMVEPMAAYYAALRGTDKEIEKILSYGKEVELKILNNEDRNNEEQLFHNSIAIASHNSVLKELMPIINKSINKSVDLSKEFKKINELTIRDHQIIMDFIKNRNSEGAKSSMVVHIVNAMDVFNIQWFIDS